MGVELKLIEFIRLERLVNIPLAGVVCPMSVLLTFDPAMVLPLIAVPAIVPPESVGFVIVAPEIVPFKNASPGTLSTVH
jgi:hypothetical protein